MSMTIRTALHQASERFAALAHANPQLDAQVLLCHVLQRGRSFLLTWPERTLTEQQSRDFERLTRRRAAGEPIAHLTGEREFWSLPLKVTADTLIPRPETELLVALALNHMPSTAPGAVADMGTGSGAVALALASERPGWQVLATDSAAAALAVARENAERLQLRNVRFEHGDWCTGLGGAQFDLVVSNPPYVPTQDPHLSAGDVRFEPRSALLAGPDGMDAIRRLARCSRAHLKPDGWLMFEHGPDQGAESRGLLTELGYRAIATHRDLGDRERVTEGCWPNIVGAP